MSRVTVLNMTQTSRSRAPHLRSTSRWEEAGLVLTLKIHKQIEDLKKPLEDYKDTLRTLAKGDNLDIIVEQLGKVTITKPRESTEKIVLELNTAKIDSNKELKKILLEKGMISEAVVKSPPAKASVNIKPNV
jgi:hypothetical protein